MGNALKKKKSNVGRIARPIPYFHVRNLVKVFCQQESVPEFRMSDNCSFFYLYY